MAAEEHLGIPPKISSHDLVNQRVPDKLAILAYVSAYYEALKNETPGIIFILHLVHFFNNFIIQFVKSITFELFPHIK